MHPILYALTYPGIITSGKMQAGVRARSAVVRAGPASLPAVCRGAISELDAICELSL